MIRPWDTFFGFRDLGFGFLFCLVAVVVIHFVLSYPTRLTRSWFPDPLWRVYLTGVRKVKVSLWPSRSRLAARVVGRLWTRVC